MFLAAPVPPHRLPDSPLDVPSAIARQRAFSQCASSLFITSRSNYSIYCSRYSNDWHSACLSPKRFTVSEQNR
jgi:hypothetical protein